MTAEPVLPQRLERRTLRQLLRALYHGDSVTALRFRTAWIVIDLAIIGFFIAEPLLRDSPSFLAVDYAIAALLGLDLGFRIYAWMGPGPWWRRISVWVDVFVLLTLLFPHALFNLGFLRVLRLWTLVNSEVFWDTVGRRYDDTRVEDVTRAGATLLTFVFITTGFVYASFAGPDGDLHGYVDALYFTVTTLTTTGFGDITLPGTWGKLLSIVIMVTGVTLFIRLAQALFRPHKVRYRCQSCGLGLHDPDAVHCKACGVLLCIPNDA